MSEPLRLSVIMPVYNEEGAIVAAVDEVKQFILELFQNRNSSWSMMAREMRPAVCWTTPRPATREFAVIHQPTAVTARRC